MMHLKYGKCMPICELKEHVCHCLLVLEQKQAFKYWHDDLHVYEVNQTL